MSLVGSRPLARICVIVLLFWILFRGSTNACAAVASLGPLKVDTDNYVTCVVVQPDGKTIISGKFRKVNGVAQAGVARLLSSGALDPTFSPVITFADTWGVECLMVQPDGKLLLGGRLLTVNGVGRTNLARLNPDGTLDASFTLAPNDVVYGFAPEPSGSFLMVGGFKKVDGRDRPLLARVNVDGTLAEPLSFSSSSSVYAIALQADGKILVGSSGVTRLLPDGTKDTTFTNRVSGTVYCISPQPDSTILVAGSIYSVGNTPTLRIARLFTDGALDASFQGKCDTDVSQVQVLEGGSILVGGLFTLVNTKPHKGLAWLDPQGIVDSSFDPQVAGIVYGFGRMANGDWAVGGVFSTLLGESHTNLGSLKGFDTGEGTISLDGDLVRWVRPPNTPRLSFARFEYFAGSGWVELPNPVWTVRGWETQAMGVSSNSSLRAYGYIAGGTLMGSCYPVSVQSGPAIALNGPHDLSIVAGQTASFWVSGADQAGGYGLQWYKDGEPLRLSPRISDVTSPTLDIVMAQGGDSGIYQLVLTKDGISYRSASARLVVLDPVISSSPGNQRFNAGDAALLETIVKGTPPLSYQWYRDGVPIPGATKSAILFSKMAASDAGVYSCSVTNQFGAVRTTNALITVNLAMPDAAWVNDTGAIVDALAEQVDGAVLYGGEFRGSYWYCGRARKDGTFDSTFSPNLVAPVTSVTTIPDWGIRLLLTGALTPGAMSGFTQRNVNGSIDGSFLPTATPDSEAFTNVLGSLLLPDGRILLWGDYAEAPGVLRGRVVRVSRSGAFEKIVDFGSNTRPLALTRQEDGKFLVGGDFQTVNGIAQIGLARLGVDMELDPDFNHAVAPNGPVRSILVQRNGKILVGGDFTSIAGVSRARVGRLNPNGTMDSSFFLDANYSVHSLAAQCDGSVVMGGHFTQIGGQSRTHLARISADGVLDRNFDVFIDKRAGNFHGVNSLILQSNGGMIVGGSFLYIGGLPRSCLGRILNTGPAEDNLVVAENRLLWRRGGTSPEFLYTTIDYRDASAHVSRIGMGSRVAEGWEFNVGPIPTNGTFFVHGITQSGYCNRSSWFVEKQLAMTAVPEVPPPSPGSLRLTAKFEVPGSFTGKFEFGGEPGTVFIFESSTNLLEWLPVSTNTIDVTPFVLQQTCSQQEGVRFYRAKLH